MIPKLSKVTIYVEDQQQAKHFWVDRMGYRVAYEQAAGPGLNWLEVAAPDSRISFVLYPKAVMQAQNPEVPVGHPSVILCFIVASALGKTTEVFPPKQPKEHLAVLWK